MSIFAETPNPPILENSANLVSFIQTLPGLSDLMDLPETRQAFATSENDESFELSEFMMSLPSFLDDLPTIELLPAFPDISSSSDALPPLDVIPPLDVLPPLAVMLEGFPTLEDVVEYLASFPRVSEIETVSTKVQKPDTTKSRSKRKISVLKDTTLEREHQMRSKRSEVFQEKRMRKDSQEFISFKSDYLSKSVRSFSFFNKEDEENFENAWKQHCLDNKIKF